MAGNLTEPYSYSLILISSAAEFSAAYFFTWYYKHARFATG